MPTNSPGQNGTKRYDSTPKWYARLWVFLPFMSLPALRSPCPCHKPNLVRNGTISPQNGTPSMVQKECNYSAIKGAKSLHPPNPPLKTAPHGAIAKSWSRFASPRSGSTIINSQSKISNPPLPFVLVISKGTSYCSAIPNAPKAMISISHQRPFTRFQGSSLLKPYSWALLTCILSKQRKLSSTP
jgi:hypothetical protein